MKLMIVTFALAAACSNGSTTGTDAGPDAGGVDANKGTDSSTPQDAAKESGGGDACAAPQGTACPTTAGNCLNIGDPCTKGGGQCPSPTACDLDLGPGVGICITFFACTRGNHDCGNGASCCDTAMTSNTPVCLPNQCLPSDCTPE
jgi:hypothetical protein